MAEHDTDKPPAWVTPKERVGPGHGQEDNSEADAPLTIKARTTGLHIPSKREPGGLLWL